MLRMKQTTLWKERWYGDNPRTPHPDHPPASPGPSLASTPSSPSTPGPSLPNTSSTSPSLTPTSYSEPCTSNSSYESSQSQHNLPHLVPIYYSPPDSPLFIGSTSPHGRQPPENPVSRAAIYLLPADSINDGHGDQVPAMHYQEFGEPCSHDTQRRRDDLLPMFDDGEAECGGRSSTSSSPSLISSSSSNQYFPVTSSLTALGAVRSKSSDQCDRDRPEHERKVNRKKGGKNKDILVAKKFGIDKEISVNEIVNLPMDEFNARLEKSTLTEKQKAEARQLRRRGKNKNAAQNCRRKKNDGLKRLEEDFKKCKTSVSRLKKDCEDLCRKIENTDSRKNQLKQLVISQECQETDPDRWKWKVDIDTETPEITIKKWRHPAALTSSEHSTSSTMQQQPQPNRFEHLSDSGNGDGGPHSSSEASGATITGPSIKFPRPVRPQPIQTVLDPRMSRRDLRGSGSNWSSTNTRPTESSPSEGVEFGLSQRVHVIYPYSSSSSSHPTLHPRAGQSFVQPAMLNQLSPGGVYHNPGGGQVHNGVVCLLPGGAHLSPRGAHLNLGGAHLNPRGAHLSPGGSNLNPSGAHLNPGGAHLIPVGAQLTTTGAHLPTGGGHLTQGEHLNPMGEHPMVGKIKGWDRNQNNQFRSPADKYYDPYGS